MRSDLGRRIAVSITFALLMAAGQGRAPAHEVGQAAPIGTSPSAIANHPSLAIIKAAPDFTLLDTKDHRLTLSRLRGRTILVSFIYTTCKTTCPLLTYRMALLADRLKHAGLWPRSISFLSVTVDPERDSASALADFAGRFDAVDPNWRFLRDEPALIRPVLAAYDEWAKPLPDGELDHPARVYLIDRRGNIREIYALAFFDERQAFIDIHTLIEEPRQKVEPSIPTLGPTPARMDDGR
jgi:cytochrome oxidase Cu insertion factor (SCO1/SenC/PrrC family)